MLPPKFQGFFPKWKAPPVTSKAPKCLMRRLQVWITDLLIEFTERFLSVYARKSSLKFFVENKSGETILLVVLR